MSTPSLNPISYVVLGIVASRGPSTSYEMKKLVGTSISFFWTFPHAQLYREPQRLAQLGMLEEEQSELGRRQRVFTITEAGREALNAWLATPGQADVEMRDPALLKLFFGRLTSPQDIVALAREQIAGHLATKAKYELLLERYAGRRELSFQLAPLRIGVAYEQAYVEFWTDVAEHPTDPTSLSEEIAARAPRSGT
ncbi:MAG TPA: PadR family transcriptional regulator [Microbacterium sp.]|uniref:PadR family transcriptional regulator n=1 Tax=Microbacterium sp. TaxID=51671 RepID=UPI002B459742|nr:PadR family transcriptional regulator [Microbacterium sp.]HKT56637.1 PadR family transcriptional regulator [Microbacterium sp.]